MILTLSFSKRINLQVTAKEDARLILVVVSYLLRFKCLTKRNGVLLLIRTVLSNKGLTRGNVSCDYPTRLSVDLWETYNDYIINISEPEKV